MLWKMIRKLIIGFKWFFEKNKLLMEAITNN
jgi:hypothetical protein